MVFDHETLLKLQSELSVLQAALTQTRSAPLAQR